MSQARDELHRLVESLSDRYVLMVKRVLEAVLMAEEEEDETLTPEEAEAVERARRQVAAGETVDWETLKEELKRGVKN